MAAIVFIVGSVRAFGTRPTLRRALSGLVVALASLVLMSSTVVLYREGNPDRLLVLLWLGVWLVFTFIRPTRRAALLCAGLFAYFLALRFQYMYLATSSRYTDNPHWRLQNAARRNRNVTIRPVAHTWLTGLYVVEPPTGGAPIRGFPDRR